MFKSIYKTIVDDFSFLKDYGFQYLDDCKHNILPSVAFVKGESTLHIGFNYEEHRMIILWFPYPHANHGFGISLAETVTWQGKSYKDQVDSAKQFVKDFLDKEMKKKP